MNPNPPRKSFLKSPEQIDADRAARDQAAADRAARTAPPPCPGLSADANLPFQRHVLICSGPHCNGVKQGHAIKGNLQTLVDAAGLQKRVKLNLVNCFDLCATASNCIIYPDAVIYSFVKPEDAAEICESHLKNDQVVERLKRKM